MIDNNKYVGNFGDVAAFSTMYRKTLHSCSSGGIIYTRNHNIYKKVIEYSDRGRKKWDPEYNTKDIGSIDAGLNYNTNEISCAIAQASLARVEKTIQERRRLLKMLQEGLGDLKQYLKVMTFGEHPSPFLVPIIFTSEGLKKKDELFKIFDNEGIPYAASYQCFAHDWSFTNKYLKNNFWNFLFRRGKKNIYSANAERLKARTFNLFLHEGYDDEYMTHVLKCFRQLS